MREEGRVTAPVATALELGDAVEEVHSESRPREVSLVAGHAAAPATAQRMDAATGGPAGAVEGEAGGLFARKVAAVVRAGHEFEIDAAALASRRLVLDPQIGELDVALDDGQVTRARGGSQRLLPLVVRLEAGPVGARVDLALQLVVQHDAIDPAAAVLDGRRLHLKHPIERRVVNHLGRLVPAGVDGLCRAVVGVPVPPRFEQCPAALGERQNTHRVPAVVHGERAPIEQALGAKRLDILCEAFRVAAIDAVAQVALEDHAEGARRDERPAFGVAKTVTPRAQVHGLPLAAVGQGEVARRQLLGSAVRVPRVIVAEQPVRPPRLLRAALVLLLACALVVAVQIQTP